MLLLVVSETGLVYTFTTPKLQPLVTKSEGKNLIQVGTLDPGAPVAMLTPPQACLNAPEPPTGNENGVDAESPVEPPEESAHQQLPPQHAGMAGAPALPPQYMTAQQQHIAYQNYLASQQQGSRAQYPMPPQAGMNPHQPQG